MGHENFATTSVYVHLTDDDLERAYRTRNGNGDMEMEKKKASNSNDPVEVAIEGLTEQVIKDNIDPERYAAAVKALRK